MSKLAKGDRVKFRDGNGNWVLGIVREYSQANDGGNWGWWIAPSTDPLSLYCIHNRRNIRRA